MNRKEWNHRLAQWQARRRRWSENGVAKVSHPRHGEVVVPHGSALSALMCAAEVWGVHWYDIRDAKVTAAEPGARPVSSPEVSA